MESFIKLIGDFYVKFIFDLFAWRYCTWWYRVLWTNTFTTYNHAGELFDDAVMKSGDNSNIYLEKSIKSEEDDHTEKIDKRIDYSKERMLNKPDEISDEDDDTIN